MAKGGARLNSGPPKDPNALRPRATPDAEWTDLPASGRVGPLPDWPIPDPSDRELVLWAEQWTRPQAVMWERNRQQLEVALMVRAVVKAEGPKATPPDRTCVRQMFEALGLSLPGLKMHRWRIVDDEEQAAPASPRTSARDRLTIVQASGE